jgi:hypothetical protein
MATLTTSQAVSNFNRMALSGYDDTNLSFASNDQSNTQLRELFGDNDINLFDDASVGNDPTWRHEIGAIEPDILAVPATLSNSYLPEDSSGLERFTLDISDGSVNRSEESAFTISYQSNDYMSFFQSNHIPQNVFSDSSTAPRIVALEGEEVELLQSNLATTISQVMSAAFSPSGQDLRHSASNMQPDIRIPTEASISLVEIPGNRSGPVSKRYIHYGDMAN